MNLLDRIRCGGIAGGLGVVIASVGVALASAQAPANQAAATPCDAHAKAINVTDFGAKGDGTTDNFKAFEAAFAYASRCQVSQVHVAAGTYSFVPDGPARGLQLPSNISLYGDGVGKSVLKVAAGKPNADYDSLLWVRNQDNVEIRGMTMVGNNVVVNNPSGQPLNTYGTAISIALDEKAGAFGEPKDLKHFIVSDCEFDNFNGAAWLRVANYHASYVIDRIGIVNNKFVSREGNAINPSNIGFTSFAVSVRGSKNSAAGLVTQVRISGNTFEATHIKGAISIWAGVRDAVIAENTILNAGADPTIPDDRGAYAISVYNDAYYYDKGQVGGKVVVLDGTAPDAVRIERNVIQRPRSCGIYTASVNRVWAVGNKISGQTDAKNQTLPKGAIVMNHPTQATVSDNQLSSNHISMTLLRSDKGRIAASNNSISNVPRGGIETIAPPADSAPH